MPIFVFFFSPHQCFNNRLTSIVPDTRIARITGNLDYRFLSDVELIFMNKATMTFMPDFTLFVKQFPKFNRIFFSDCGLKYVERRQLAKIPQLTFISFLNNLIERVPEDAFSDLVKLEELWVSSNKIRVLPPKLLWNLPKLRRFGADKNQIELIPRDFFKNNRELKTFWINDNKITRIEVDLTLLPKLTILYMMRNSCLSDEFCDPCSIDQLREIQEKINRNCTGRA
jgi:Leucine-rich repeat (LRR) protein